MQVGCAVDTVLSSTDLLQRVLSGNVGVTTFVMASRVCRAWRCATTGEGASEGMLVEVAGYTGGLIKRDFVGLLAISRKEADAHEHKAKRRMGGGHYHLYSRGTFEAAIRRNGGVHGWRLRLNLRRLDEPARTKRPWEWGKREGEGVVKRRRREDWLHAVSVR